MTRAWSNREAEAIVLSRAAFILILACWLATGCEQSTPAQKAVDMTSSKPTPAEPIPLATDRDTDGIDEGLRIALRNVRNKFKCNRISGCKPQDVAIGFGRHARPFVEQLFASAPRRAPWRSRTVRIVAELRDPDALPFLVERLGDRNEAVIAYAAYGLVLLDYRAEQKRFEDLATAGAGLMYAKTRLSTRWALARWGVKGAKAAFKGELEDRVGQLLGSGAVTWGLYLCTQWSGVDCERSWRLAARHPAFVVRRAVAERFEAVPRKRDIPVLVELAADPVPSVGRRARAVLVQLTGEAGLRDGGAWRKWCDERKCDASIAAASEGQRKASGAAATP